MKFKPGDYLHKIGSKDYFKVLAVDEPFLGMYKLLNVVTKYTMGKNRDIVERRCVKIEIPLAVKILYESR